MMKTSARIGLAVTAAVLGMALSAGPALAKAKPPAIKSVKFDGTPSEPLIVVKGIGLGSFPAGSAEEDPNCFAEEPSGLGNDFGTAAVFSDTSAGWDSGEGPGDCIGLIFKTYTETEVVFHFGSAYTHYVPVHKGDGYTLTLNALSKSGTVKIKEPKK